MKRIIRMILTVIISAVCVAGGVISTVILLPDSPENGGNTENGGDDTATVQSIKFESGTINVLAGTDLSKISFTVLKVYAGGSTATLSSSEYTLSGNTGTVAIGGMYTVTATAGDKTATAKVVEASRFQAEAAHIVGGKATTESGISFAGNFNTNKIANNYIIFDIYSGATTKALTINCANGYLMFIDSQYYMEVLQLNLILDVYVNDQLITIDDSVVLPGTEVLTKWQDGFVIFTSVNLGNVNLNSGKNTIKLNFKLSSLANYWNESPVLNVDWIELA